MSKYCRFRSFRETLIFTAVAVLSIANVSAQTFERPKAPIVKKTAPVLKETIIQDPRLDAIEYSQRRDHQVLSLRLVGDHLRGDVKTLTITPQRDKRCLGSCLTKFQLFSTSFRKLKVTGTSKNVITFTVANYAKETNFPNDGAALLRQDSAAHACAPGACSNMTFSKGRLQ